MGFLGKFFGKTNADPEKEYIKAFELETEQNRYEKALFHYEKAAKQGMIEAQYYAGFMYLRGRGTKKNLVKAFYWLEMAAKADHPKAQYLLSQMYMMGEGVEKNEAVAKEWLEKSESYGFEKDQPIVSFHVY